MSETMEQLRLRQSYIALTELLNNKPLPEQISELIAVNFAMMILLAEEHSINPMEAFDLFDAKYQKIRTGLREAIERSAQ